MPNTWPSLVYTRDPSMLIKAPSKKIHDELEHQREEYGVQVLHKEVSAYAELAKAIATAIPDVRVLGRPGEAKSFTLYRNPMGIGVECPGGWKFMLHLDPSTGEYVKEPSVDRAPRPGSRQRKAAGEEA